jgi:fumarate reductase subunit D
MILGGMGPVNELHADSGKLFAAAYALFSGIIFLVAIAVILAPALHRFLHRFHIDLDSENPTEE